MNHHRFLRHCISHAHSCLNGCGSAAATAAVLISSRQMSPFNCNLVSKVESCKTVLSAPLTEIDQRFTTSYCRRKMPKNWNYLETAGSTLKSKCPPGAGASRIPCTHRPPSILYTLGFFATKVECMVFIIAACPSPRGPLGMVGGKRRIRLEVVYIIVGAQG